jgi:hypothetical protein
MKIARDIITLVLAGAIATVILALVPAPKKSFYGSMPPTLSQGPLEDSGDKALLAVGLVSKKSVMDGPSTKLQPSKPPPAVPEHVNPPAPETPAPAPPPAEAPSSGPQASKPESTDMSTLPPKSSAPPPPPPPPAPPGPEAAKPESTDMASVPSVSSQSTVTTRIMTKTSPPA